MTGLHTFLAKLNHKKNDQPLNYRSGPETDWKKIFGLTVILILLAIGLSTWVFIKIDRRDVYVVEGLSEETVRSLNISLLRETVSYYQTKALEFENTINYKTTLTDPSL